MFDFLIEVIATLLSGYFSKKAPTGKMTETRYFFAVFFVVFLSYVGYITLNFLISGESLLSFKKIVVAFVVSIMVSLILCLGLGLVYYLKLKK